MKSHLLLSHLAKGSETRCSFNGSLPVQAKLATAWSEATGTMKPFAREGKAARQYQPLPASGGRGARLNSKTNTCELLLNLVIFDKPKMLTGLDQKVSDGLLVCFLRAQGQKKAPGERQGLPYSCNGCGTW